MKRKIVSALILFAMVFPVAIFAAPISKNPLLTKEGAGGGVAKHVAITKPKPPVRIGMTEIESQIHAKAYVVVDRTTGKILTMKQENLLWPIASLTKLMTASVVLEKVTDVTKVTEVTKADDVGGAKLYVKNGDKFSVDDLFYAMLSGSANNAANALARTCSSSREEFVTAMNARAKFLGLNHTTYVDPSGMGLENTSTVLDIAKLGDMMFKHPQVKRYTTTARKNIRVANTGSTKKITSTNWMLYKSAYDDVWVTGGKTGYLEESGWNLAVALRPFERDTTRELLLVVFGSTSRAQLFEDANVLADWAWNVHEWK